MEKERGGNVVLKQWSVSPHPQQSQVSKAMGFCLKSLISMACLLICADNVLRRSNSLLTFRRVILHPDYIIQIFVTELYQVWVLNYLFSFFSFFFPPNRYEHGLSLGRGTLLLQAQTVLTISPSAWGKAAALVTWQVLSLVFHPLERSHPSPVCTEQAWVSAVKR